MTRSRFKFEHISSHLPSKVTEYFGDEIKTDYKFNPDGILTGLVYTSKSGTYTLAIGEKILANLKVIGSSNIEQLRFRHVKAIKDEDKLVLKLKYNIDISMLHFNNSSQLTPDCLNRIHRHIYELALTHIKHQKRSVGANMVRWLWEMDPDIHLKVFEDSLNSNI